MHAYTSRGDFFSRKTAFFGGFELRTFFFKNSRKLNQHLIPVENKKMPKSNTIHPKPIANRRRWRQNSFRNQSWKKIGVLGWPWGEKSSARYDKREPFKHIWMILGAILAQLGIRGVPKSSLLVRR